MDLTLTSPPSSHEVVLSPDHCADAKRKQYQQTAKKDVPEAGEKTQHDKEEAHEAVEATEKNTASSNDSEQKAKGTSEKDTKKEKHPEKFTDSEKEDRC